MESGLPAAESLWARLGRPRLVRRVDSSPRSLVWFAELSGAPVVIKHLVAGEQAVDRYAQEVTALRLAAAADPPVVPALLGAHSEDRVLVLEYLPHRPPAEDWLLDYATALARLHAVGRTASPADVASLPVATGPQDTDVAAFLALGLELGCAPPDGVHAELAELLDRLTALPPDSLLHGDPCPGNDLYTEHGPRFVDFEQATFGNGLVELAYARIGFPTCWCATVAEPARLAAAENAYRVAWRAATGTDVTGDLADACAGWLLRGDALVQRAQRGAADWLAELPNQDWIWGTATARQRFAHRLAIVAELATRDGPLARLGQLAAQMHTASSTRWPLLRLLPTRRP